MKKKVLSKKLRLNKCVVSSLQAADIKGGGTGDCAAQGNSRACPPVQSLIDCPPNWTELKTR